MLLKDDYDYMTNIVEVKPCDNCNSESQSEEIVSIVVGEKLNFERELINETTINNKKLTVNNKS